MEGEACRTCLRLICSANQPAKSLNEAEDELDNITLRHKLLTCVPELSIDGALNPILCSTCCIALGLAFQFKTLCLESEKTVMAAIKTRQMEQKSDLLPIHELLKIVPKKAVNGEHNYSTAGQLGTLDSESECDEELMKPPATSVVVKNTKTPTANNLSPKLFGKFKLVKFQEPGVVAAKGSPLAPNSPTKPESGVQKESSLATSPRLAVVKTEISPRGSKRQVLVSLSPSPKGTLTFRHLPPRINTARYELFATTSLPKDDGEAPTPKSYFGYELPEMPIVVPFEEVVIAEKFKEGSPGNSNKIHMKLDEVELETAETKNSSERALSESPNRKMTDEKVLVVKKEPAASKADDSKLDESSKTVTRLQTKSAGNAGRLCTRKRKKNFSIRKEFKKRFVPQVKVEDLQEEPNKIKKEFVTPCKREVRTNVSLAATKAENSSEADFKLKEESNNAAKDFEDIPNDSTQNAVANTCEFSSAAIKRYICEKCNKGYDFKSHFDVHLKSHIIKKLYQCPLCDKTFTQGKYLVAHKVMHDQMGTYKCEVCLKSLSASSTLRRHMRTHTGEKPYSCETCGKSFAQKIQRNVHMRTHSGLRPFVCNVCRQNFSQKSHLQGHMRVHTGEKPYKCAQCPKVFRKSYALQVHLHSHSIKPYQCSACNYLFKDNDAFRKHISKHLMNLVPLELPIVPKKKQKPKTQRKILEELEQDIRDINMGVRLTEQMKVDCGNLEAQLKEQIERLGGNFVLRRLNRRGSKRPALFSCKVCNRSFTTKFSRKRHMVMHEGNDSDEQDV